MKREIKSPRIDSISWGNVQIEGQKFKDVKLFPGGCREWNWNETGTHHIPGIQPADIKELLEHEARVIVLSKGINRRLQISEKAKTYLDDHGVEYFIMQTEEAVEKYNKLRRSAPVGSLIHSTC